MPRDKKLYQMNRILRLKALHVRDRKRFITILIILVINVM